MIHLNSTTQSLQVALGAAKATNDCPIYASTTPGAHDIDAARSQSTNGTTAVTVVSAPSSGGWKALKSLFIYNYDTAAIVVTLQIADTAASNTPLILFTLLVPVGQALVYLDGVGPKIIGSADASGRIATLTAQGTLKNSFTTAASLLPASAVPTLPANFWQVGKTLRIIVSGGLSNVVTAGPTFTFNVMLGSVIVFTTGAIQCNDTAHTLLPFWLEILMTCRSIGSGTSAKFIGQAVMKSLAFTRTADQVDGVNSDNILMCPATAPALGTGFDSTAAAALDLYAACSTSNSGNGVQVEQYTATII